MRPDAHLGAHSCAHVSADAGTDAPDASAADGEDP